MSNLKRAKVVVLIKSLQRADLTVKELITRTRMSKSAVYNWLEAFRLAGMAHRPEWRPHRGRPEAVYAWGPGLDRLMPAPLGNTERHRRYRRQKSRPEVMLTDILLKQRTTHV